MPPVTITYRLSEDAFMRGCYQLWAHRALGRTGNYVVAGLVAFCGLFLLWQGVPGVWGPLLIIGALAVVALDIGRDRAWRRYYRHAPKYRGAITASFLDTGVYVESEEGENSVFWAQFKSYVITRDFLFLIIEQRQFSVIPRSAFATAKHHAAVEDLLRAHLKPLKSRLL